MHTLPQSFSICNCNFVKYAKVSHHILFIYFFYFYGFIEFDDRFLDLFYFSMLVFLFYCSYHAFYMLYSALSLLIRSLFTYFALFFFQLKNAGLHPN